MNTKIQCPYCGVGCGLRAFDDFGKVKIMGDSSHPSGKGDLCQKPLSLPMVQKIGRVDKPLYRADKNSEFRVISWSMAIEILANEIQNRDTSELFCYLSGQLLTEESYIFTKLFKGYLKTNNIDANSRLCMATAVTAYKMAFGSDGVPASMDMIEQSDCFIFAGSNPSWAHPVLFKRVIATRNMNDKAKVVVIDPIKTASALKADLFIQLNAGSDTVLFNGVLKVLSEQNAFDWEFINNYTQGFSEALDEAKKLSLQEVALICGIQIEEIMELAKLFVTSKSLLSFWCQGLNQSSNGTVKNLSLINLHLATGRIGSKGSPFSLTGQPNAMGGREVGYLSAGLPAYRAVTNKHDRAFMENFWKLKANSINPKAGKTVVEAVESMEKKEITLFWSVCTNPVVSMPNLNRFMSAFNSQDVFVVAQEAYHNETTKVANLVLPALQWGEKEGVMTNLERVVTKCEKLYKSDNDAKSDWEIGCLVAKKLGFKGFEFRNAKEIYDEFRATTKGRLCDVSSIGYKHLPKQYGSRELYHKAFATPNKKANFHRAVFTQSKYIPNEKYPFILTSGRTKKQWHTMSRTGKYAPLLKGEEEAFVMINAQDATTLGVTSGDRVKLTSPMGAIELKVQIGEIKPKHLFVPFGYGDKPTNRLFSDAVCPYSGQPELKYVCCGVNRL